MKRQSFFLVVFLLLTATTLTFSQYTPWHYQTLLPGNQMDEIIGEASGETAWKTIMETAGYTRNRRPEEYRTIFREAAYILDKLEWYGIEARLERVPARRETTWNGIKGELWEVSPGRRKLVSYRENAFQLTMGSNSADVRAELVWVGSGTYKEVLAEDVAGKIAVGHGNVSLIHASSMAAGAVGVIAISNSRNYFDPLQIPEGRIADVTKPGTNEIIKAGFAFQMNIREGQFLRDRLLRGEKIEVHAQVETSMEPDEIQNIDAIIHGTDPNQTAVIFSAHIFEGLVKQGANDNMSGGAAILEVARVLNTLIEEGRLPRPKRSIRFFWGPEFLGTRPWVDMNFDDIKDAYCNINMDMVGEWLSLNNAHFTLMRTTFGNPHYINDVTENYFRFVGEGNRDRVHNRRYHNSIPHRIVAPFGADEPFHYSIETHYGSSDHVVFGDFGVRIPGIMMIAWPDQWYHTSGDVIDKADPTQLKRAVVIGAAAAFTIANADDDMAVRIAGEIAGNAVRRMGHQLIVANDLINGSNAGDLEEKYKKAVWLLEANIANEKATLESVYELSSSKALVDSHIKAMKSTIDQIGVAQLSALESQMRMKAGNLSIAPVEIQLSRLEKKAMSTIPSLSAGMMKTGQGKLTELLAAVPESKMKKYPVTTRIDRTEIARLVNGTNSVLTIKKMMDAQQPEETDLSDLMNFVNQLNEAGIVVF
jgi:aminopeptidase YwaD